MQNGRTEARGFARGRRLTAALLLIAVIAVMMGITACGENDQIIEKEHEIEKQSFYLNTVCNIRLQEWEGDEAAGEALVDQAFALCGQLEQKLSRTISGSDIDRINTAMGQPVDIDDEDVAAALELGMEYSQLSGGRFDITVGRLSELWNFSAEEPSVPEADAIREAVTHVGYENFSIKPASSEDPMTVEGGAGVSSYTATLSDPQAKIDLGAVAKGYIVDRVSDFLRENGVTRGIVDFGGNISCIGAKEAGEPWVIGVRRPLSADEEQAVQSQTIGTVQVGADCSAVTSGTYERCFTQDGTTYHHILDPATGYPCDTDVKSVTIIGGRSGQCDGLSTVCLLLGMEDGLALIESMPEFEAVFVDASGRVESTSGAMFQPME